MKRVALVALVLSVSLLFLSSSSATAQERKTYVAVKAGVYGPTGDLDDAEFETGFNGEVALGRYVNPNLAIELGAGYFLTEASYSAYYVEPGVGSVSAQETDEVKVIPLTITAKGVLPLDMLELYLGGGVGWYIGSFESEASVTATVLDVPYRGTGTFDGDDSVFGAHVVGGAIINIAEAFFIGVEAKHVWTEVAKVSGTVQVTVDGQSLGVPFEIEGDVNGYVVTGVVGFRF